MILSLFISFLINAAALWVVTMIIPGISVDSAQTLAISAIVIGLINSLIRPLVKLLTLPISVITLGLFALVVNGLMLILASWFVQGLTIEGIVPAILGAIILSLVSAGLGFLFKRDH